MRDEFERTLGKGKKLEIPLLLKDWQSARLDAMGVNPQTVSLEVSLTRIHKYPFSRGPREVAELGDFVLHVEYTSPNRYFGLSNFFQIKRITNDNVKALIDLKQLRFLTCRGTMRVGKWKLGVPINPSDFERAGPWSHYWFIHTSTAANRLLAPVLLANSANWRIYEEEWVGSQFFDLVIGRFAEKSHTSLTDEFRTLNLGTSFMCAEGVTSLLRMSGLNNLCNLGVQSLKPRSINLIEGDKPISPIQPGGVELSDCLFLRHGISTSFIQSIVAASKNKGLAESASNSGLAVIIKVRAGGPEYRNDNEFIPEQG